MEVRPRERRESDDPENDVAPLSISPSCSVRYIPPPNFRYVGLEPSRRPAGLTQTLLAGTSLGASVALLCGLGGRHALAGAVVGSLSAIALQTMTHAAPGVGPRLAIVPWGVLVDPEESPRALRWAAVRKVSVDMAYGRDGGNTTTVSSYVTVATDRETFVGSAHGAVPLERLQVHLEAYAEEQSRPIALDLDGAIGFDATEPDCGSLLVAARSWLESASALQRLDLGSGHYRRASSGAASPAAVQILREILRGRRERTIESNALADNRAFAAVVAAELGAAELVGDLIELVQQPHPVIAAIAKQAARRLGASTSRAGALDEIALFLAPDDELALRAWGGA